MLPSRSKFFHSHAVFANIFPDNMLTHFYKELAPLWKILDPSLVFLLYFVFRLFFDESVASPSWAIPMLEAVGISAQSMVFRMSTVPANTCFRKALFASKIFFEWHSRFLTLMDYPALVVSRIVTYYKR